MFPALFGSLTCALLVAAPRLAAASPSPESRIACGAPEFQQFSFWVGKWTVRNADGKEVGSSEITLESAGCAMREQWTAAAGGTGMSVNYFDASDGQWHQEWVGGDGTILHLRGGPEGNAMVLRGDSLRAEKALANRITWTPLDGKVKQEWATSSDGGKTWQIAFVGWYEPRR